MYPAFKVYDTENDVMVEVWGKNTWQAIKVELAMRKFPKHYVILVFCIGLLMGFLMGQEKGN